MVSTVGASVSSTAIASRYTAATHGPLHGKNDADGDRVSLSAPAVIASSSDSVDSLGLPSIKLFNASDVAEYQQTLTAALKAIGVDADTPIKLATNGEGEVVVRGSHPDKKAIEELFESDMNLRNGYVQTQNHFLFKKLASLNAQWAKKIEQGLSEEAAGLWLLNAAKLATGVSSNGLTFHGAGFDSPFGDNRMQVYDSYS